MTIPKFFVALGIVALLQSGVFAWKYSDLLYLNRPEAEIAASAPDTFAHHADIALARPRLTRRHLDTIADMARKFGETAYEVRALRRRLEMDPQDQEVKLRLADALRRSGAFAESEALYLGVLDAPRGGGR